MKKGDAPEVEAPARQSQWGAGIWYYRYAKTLIG